MIININRVRIDMSHVETYAPVSYQTSGSDSRWIHKITFTHINKPGDTDIVLSSEEERDAVIEYLDKVCDVIELNYTTESKLVATFKKTT